MGITNNSRKDRINTGQLQSLHPGLVMSASFACALCESAPASAGSDSNQRGEGTMSAHTITVQTSFDEWMRTVNDYVWKYAGCSGYDLDDCCYRDWYDDNVQSQTAAKRAIRRAGLTI